MTAALAKFRRFLTPERDVSSRWMAFLLIPVTVYQKSRRVFYNGPAAYNYPGRKMTGYRSPNVLLSLWIHAGLTVWLTPYGRYLLFAGAVFLLIGVTSILMPAYVLAFGLTSLFLVDVLAGWLFRPRLEVHRRLPQLASADSPITIDYQITNTGPRSCWGLFVDVLPAAGARRLEGLPWIRDLAPGDAVSTRSQLVIPHRGRVELPVCLVSSAFPFGLWRWSSRAQPNAPIHVYPSYRRLHSISLSPGGRARHGHAIASSKASESVEFMGIREYRYGDNPRLIHARSWARLQQPVVKEFRDESMTRVALIVDTCCAPQSYWQQLRKRPNPSLEAALYLAAACTDTLCRQNYVIDYFAVGQVSEHSPGFVEGTRGAGQLEAILKAVAAVKSPDDETFPGLPREHMRRMDEISSALVILQELDPPRRLLLRSLQSRGVAVKPILLTPSEQSTSGKEHPPELTVLHCDIVLAGEVTEL